MKGKYLFTLMLCIPVQTAGMRFDFRHAARMWRRSGRS